MKLLWDHDLGVGNTEDILKSLSETAKEVKEDSRI